CEKAPPVAERGSLAGDSYAKRFADVSARLRQERTASRRDLAPLSTYRLRCACDASIHTNASPTALCFLLVNSRIWRSDSNSLSRGPTSMQSTRNFTATLTRLNGGDAAITSLSRPIGLQISA